MTVLSALISQCAEARVIAGPTRTIRGEHLTESFLGQDHSDLFALLPDPSTSDPVVLNRYELDDAFLCFGPGRDGVVFTKGGTLIRESALFSADLSEITLEYLQSNARRLVGNFFSATEPGWYNYYHWLCLALNRYMCFGECGDELTFVLPDFDAFITAGGSANFSRETWAASLKAAGLRQPLFRAPPGVYSVEKLHLAYTNYFQPAMVTLLPEVMSRYRAEQGFGEQRQGSARRVLVKRAHNPRLHVEHASKAEEIALAHGFDLIVLETLKFEEQLTLFRNASHVIAPHGAGIANLVFSHPGVRVLELNAALDGGNILRPWFYLLTAVVGGRYRYVDTSRECSPTRFAQAIGSFITAGIG